MAPPQTRFVIQQMVCIRVSVSSEQRIVNELLSWTRERGLTFSRDPSLYVSQDAILYVGYFRPDDAGKIIEWLNARGAIGVRA